MKYSLKSGGNLRFLVDFLPDFQSMVSRNKMLANVQEFNEKHKNAVQSENRYSNQNLIVAPKYLKRNPSEVVTL